jgi:hypothetical protein
VSLHTKQTGGWRENWLHRPRLLVGGAPLQYLFGPDFVVSPITAKASPGIGPPKGFRPPETVSGAKQYTLRIRYELN